MDSDVKIIITDLDGVLTDGTLTIDHKGEKLFKKFHTRDVRAIRELVANGYEVYIVSADDWQGTEHFAEKVGAVFVSGKDKGTIATHITKGKPYYAVGDDAWDKEMMEGAEKCFCPADADPSVHLCNVISLRAKGGQGVIAELARKLLKNSISL